MADNNRFFDRPGFGNHNVPASSRQGKHTTVFDNGPKHGGMRRNNRIPASQQPKRPIDNKR